MLSENKIYTSKHLNRLGTVDDAQKTYIGQGINYKIDYFTVTFYTDGIINVYLEEKNYQYKTSQKGHDSDDITPLIDVQVKTGVYHKFYYFKGIIIPKGTTLTFDSLLQKTFNTKYHSRLVFEIDSSNTLDVSYDIHYASHTIKHTDSGTINQDLKGSKY